MTSSSAPGDHLKALGATPGVTRTTAPFWIWLEWELGGMGEWWAGVSPTLWKCKSLAAEMNDPAGWQAGFPVGDICHFHSPARSPPLPSPPLSSQPGSCSLPPSPPVRGDCPGATLGVDCPGCAEDSTSRASGNGPLSLRGQYKPHTSLLCGLPC